MNSRGALQIDPESLDTGGSEAELEVVVPYTGQALTAAVLDRAKALTAGLNAKIELVAVHAVPYPAPFECPSAQHAFLVEELIGLAGRCGLEVHPQVVLARSSDEGFRHVLKPGSTVLIGARKHFWRTTEEKLAVALVRDGHKVALLHVA